MQETVRRHCHRAGFAEGLAGVYITRIGEDGGSVLRINGQGVLRRGMRKLIQRRIDPGEQDKEADDQENKSF